jgi:dephospho-CoA kinase
VEPVVIGLTGGIACGKSTVARILKSKNAIIIDADLESKKLMQTGSPIWTKLAAEFGREILNPDNTISRSRLGDMVFGDKDKLNKLNSIVHPGVIEHVADEIRRYKTLGRWPAIVLDAPLLFEAGAEKLVDFTWVVAVDRQTQINRLLARDKITPEQAVQRIEAQMPLEKKVALADAVINNTGSRRATRALVNALWNQYVERG